MKEIMILSGFGRYNPYTQTLIPENGVSIIRKEGDVIRLKTNKKSYEFSLCPLMDYNGGEKIEIIGAYLQYCAPGSAWWSRKYFIKTLTTDSDIGMEGTFKMEG